MSELKVYHCNEWHNEYTEFYMKFEADKVIAEKNTKIIQLEALIENYNRISSEIIDNANHQKYKRCLAMAEYFKRKRIDAADYRIPRKKWEFYDKWYNRWLKISEQFKEAK